ENGHRQEYGLPDTKTFFAIPAPGQPAEANLWLIMDSTGKFSAPEGVVGFRPLADRVRTARIVQVDTWLVLYHRPDDPNAPRWSLADSKLTNIPTPIYSDVRIVLPPQPNPPSHPGGEGFATGTEEEPFLMLQKDGVWESARVLSPNPLP